MLTTRICPQGLDPPKPEIKCLGRAYLILLNLEQKKNPPALTLGGEAGGKEGDGEDSSFQLYTKTMPDATDSKKD